MAIISSYQDYFTVLIILWIKNMSLIRLFGKRRWDPHTIASTNGNRYWWLVAYRFQRRRGRFCLGEDQLRCGLRRRSTFREGCSSGKAWWSEGTQDTAVEPPASGWNAFCGFNVSGGFPKESTVAKVYLEDISKVSGRIESIRYNQTWKREASRY